LVVCSGNAIVTSLEVGAQGSSFLPIFCRV